MCVGHVAGLWFAEEADRGCQTDNSSEMRFRYARQNGHVLDGYVSDQRDAGKDLELSQPLQARQYLTLVPNINIGACRLVWLL